MLTNIAFYLPNGPLGNIDYRPVTKYNPGIGGTEYLFVLNAVALSQYSDFHVTIYLESAEGLFPDSISTKAAGPLKDAIKMAKEDGINIFVAKHHPAWISEGCYENVPKDLHLIVWNHILLSKAELDYYFSNSSIESVICVGREHLDLYLDHPVYEKMDYIYNGLPFPDKDELYNSYLPIENRKPIVTYISSIMPFKGFHWLAKAWPKVIKEVPDAQLMVIGSGTLYDNRQILGKYGITESHYEEEFMRYLTDDRGNILPSVHFLGKMGEEKNAILKNTKVGVPNPTGFNETFCLSAVDMQVYGCSIVSIASPAYLDTVVDKRRLAKRASGFADSIIKELKSPLQINHSLIYDQLSEKFHYMNVAAEWHEFFIGLLNGEKKLHASHPIPNLSKNYKWWRYFIHKLYNHWSILASVLTKWQYSRYVRKIKKVYEQYEYKQI